MLWDWKAPVQFLGFCGDTSHPDRNAATMAAVEILCSSCPVFYLWTWEKNPDTAPPSHELQSSPAHPETPDQRSWTQRDMSAGLICQRMLVHLHFCVSPQVSTSVSSCQVLSIGTNTQHSDPGLPISPCCLPLRLQVLRVLPHIQNPQQVLRQWHRMGVTGVYLKCVIVLFVPVTCWSYIAVEVPVPGGGVGVPQSDGVIWRACEEGGRGQTSLRHVWQLRIHLKDDHTPNLWVEILHSKKFSTKSCNSTSGSTVLMQKIC